MSPKQKKKPPKLPPPSWQEAKDQIPVFTYQPSPHPTCSAPGTRLHMPEEQHVWCLSFLDPTWYLTQCEILAQSANWNTRKNRTGKGEGRSIAVQQHPLLAKEKTPTSLLFSKNTPRTTFDPWTSPISSSIWTGRCPEWLNCYFT